ncbi:uncharacterized protein LOC141907998 isoform X2 [Tubulanus polymorphus]|uniref:uncharacterized protein LOC141907998 isoform X2 n=1 Tax=Tubulanus polymorphus TaxID=672921 RepID=UPI003DA27980
MSSEESGAINKEIKQYLKLFCITDNENDLLEIVQRIESIAVIHDFADDKILTSEFFRKATSVFRSPYARELVTALIAALNGFTARDRVRERVLKGGIHRDVLKTLRSVVGSKHPLDRVLADQASLFMRNLSKVPMALRFHFIDDNVVGVYTKLLDCWDSQIFQPSESAMNRLGELALGKSLIAIVAADEEKHFVRRLKALRDVLEIPCFMRAKSLELYDTTSPDKDVNIRVEMMKLADIWSEVKLDADNLNEDRTVAVVEEKKYVDVEVTFVVDGCSFWAQLSKTSIDKVKEIRQKITSFSPEERKYLQMPPPNGCFVCLSHDSNPINGYARGIVLTSTENSTTVFTLDYGVKVTVPWSQLFYISPKMGLKGLGPQAVFCRLNGTCPATSHRAVLNNILGTFYNLSIDSISICRCLFDTSAMDRLLQLSVCTDADVSMHASNVIGSIAAQSSLREKVAQKGALKLMLDLSVTAATEPFNDDKARILSASLGAIVNILYNCLDNKNMFLGLDGLETVRYIYKNVTHTECRGRISQLINVLKAQNKATRCQVAKNKPTSTKSDGDVDYFARPRRKSVELSQHAIRKVTMVALNKERLKDDSSDEEVNEPLLMKNRSNDSQTDVVPVNAAYMNVDCSYYVQGLLVNFKHDEKNEIITTTQLHQISSDVLEKIVCGFLNSGITGSIYFGIAKELRVIGIRITRPERDEFRLAVDRFMGRLKPIINPTAYEVTYSPVVYKQNHDSPESRIHLNDLHVIVFNPA